MTCVVAWVSEREMIMAADSIGADSGWHARVRQDPKIFRLSQPDGPDVLVGFTTSYRMGQLLMDLEVPRDDGDPPFRFIRRRFVQAVRDALRGGGYLRIENNREDAGDFLVAYRGALFRLFSDLQVEHVTEAYHAVGCGAPYALGALAAWELMALTEEAAMTEEPEASLRNAIGIAERFSAGVRGPVRIERVDLSGMLSHSE